MAIQAIVDVPEPLHERLSHKAKQSGTPIEALIIEAVERAYSEVKKGNYVTGALVKVKGELGPEFPVDKNPYDLVFP